MDPLVTEHRKLFAKLLEDSLTMCKQGDCEVMFIAKLDQAGLGFEDSQSLADTSLNAAWHLSDDFFDAVWHGFPEVGPGLSIKDGEKLLDHVIDCFRQEQEVTHPDILKFYESPLPSHTITEFSKRGLDLVKHPFS